MLLPQHFQQSDIRNAELLVFNIAQVSPFHWGVSHSLLDKTLLVGGKLHYSELEAIMPDGLVISSFDANGETLEVDLNEYKATIEQKPTIVYLAVAKYQYGVANNIGENPRFIPLRGSEVVDENSGQGAVEGRCHR